MKNRKMLIVLVPAVLIIWGAVIYSIYSHLQGPDLNMKRQDRFVLHKNSDIDTSKYRLLANYRDPFGTGNKIREDDLERENLLKNQHLDIPVNWPQIEYRGLIINNKKWVALLKINNSNFLMQVGEEKSNIKLIKMYNDSALLKFQKATKTFIKFHK